MYKYPVKFPVISFVGFIFVMLRAQMFRFFIPVLSHSPSYQVKERNI